MVAYASRTAAAAITSAVTATAGVAVLEAEIVGAALNMTDLTLPQRKHGVHAPS